VNAPGFALFDTGIGRCGVVWGPRGLVGVQLPEGRDADTRLRVQSRFPHAREAEPPPPVGRALEAIRALLAGEAGGRQRLAEVALDMQDVPPFHRRVYQAVRAVPPGATVSYGDIAARLGVHGAARAVGQALKRNPFAIVVPCHRVLAAGGKVGGFSARGGITTKLRLLQMESAGIVGPEGAEPAGAEADEPRAPPFDARKAVAHLRRSDPQLGNLIAAVGPCGLTIDRTSNIFAALARAIVYQQLNGKAAATILARVQALFPRARAGFTPEQLLRASDDKLRGAGLSRSKMLSLQDLARKVEDGTVPSLDEIREMPDDVVVDRLTEVRGIGRWTAQMLLMFRLGRPDVLPVDDYGVRQGFAAAFKRRELPSAAELEKRGEKWRPYRSVACWYLWRAAERRLRRPAAATAATTG
jgi:methylated-DNA-[protein]-cysteine S-methyltransferase